MNVLKLDDEQKKIKTWLQKNNFKEPTTKDFLTYVAASKKYGQGRTVGPFFEDAHWAWRNKLYGGNGYQ